MKGPREGSNIENAHLYQYRLWDAKRVKVETAQNRGVSPDGAAGYRDGLRRATNGHPLSAEEVQKVVSRVPAETLVGLQNLLVHLRDVSAENAHLYQYRLWDAKRVKVETAQKGRESADRWQPVTNRARLAESARYPPGTEGPGGVPVRLDHLQRQHRHTRTLHRRQADGRVVAVNACLTAPEASAGRLLSLLDQLRPPDAGALPDWGLHPTARRIMTKRGTVSTNNIILTFDSTDLPSEIRVGYVKVRVRPFVPAPMRCFRCQRFGHTKDNCRGRPTCSKCASQDHTDETCDSETPRCVNCGEGQTPHSAYDRSCPAYVKEKEIMTIKATRNLSFKEAREVYNQSHPKTSYAQKEALRRGEEERKAREARRARLVQKALEAKEASLEVGVDRGVDTWLAWKQRWDDFVMLTGLDTATEAFQMARLRSCLGDDTLRIEVIDKWLFLYRVTPHATTGETPGQLLLGYKPITRLDKLKPDIEDKLWVSPHLELVT
ncbi:Nucleic-acid-binding protein from mobile element jockey [Amphibalanus amphitrite]|uniref:Nucleic-acid-binding protein from mobile element jockey n=1 Tax=Amphibalanus amphitrite TaxID=1232801 RepID=A0A6A4X003_AMPAM|nr:Nucleic-acid-binding protein from mobile element jockey [Amphibalanus amphitrite]